MRALNWVLGWCNVLGLGGKEIRKKWGSLLGLLRIVLWVAQGWSSRRVLHLWNVLGCSHWGLLHIGYSWRVGQGLFGWVFAQSVPSHSVPHPLVFGARSRRSMRNPECRAEHTSLGYVWIWVFGLCLPFI